MNIRRALISVYDKTGVLEFARTLHGEFGVELISTGGTARALRDGGLPVTLVEDLTGSAELLDGRVKTLHPVIHAAILADRDNPAHVRQLQQHGITAIDMVVVNLYPFAETVADPACPFERAIEMIDIGGPCLLRAAAKNHRHVLVVRSLDDQRRALAAMRGGDLESAARENAAGVFAATAGYDAQVLAWIERGRARELDAHEQAEPLLPSRSLWQLRRREALRYGENPHQRAELADRIDQRPGALTPRAPSGGAPPAQPALSFNNHVDATAALDLCAELARSATLQTSPGHAACFIKHTNPCGTAVDADPVAAYRNAYLGDPNAAMGGILAVSVPVDTAFAVAVLETYQRFGKPLRDAGHPAAPGGFFLEVWIAPRFTPDAVALVRGNYDPATASPQAGESRIDAPPKKEWGTRVRLLEVGDMSAAPDPDALAFRQTAGGILAQTPDTLGLNEQQWQVVTRRGPDARELADLRLAWLICKHTKSNAISVCRDGMLLGNGAGQMSRVMSCRIATWLARENGHAHRLSGAAAASDAFFPFRDGPDILIDAGVTALIQPGGSKRDADVIAACDERDVAMVFTGTRHFRH